MSPACQKCQKCACPELVSPLQPQIQSATLAEDNTLTTIADTNQGIDFYDVIPM